MSAKKPKQPQTGKQSKNSSETKPEDSQVAKETEKESPKDSTKPAAVNKSKDETKTTKKTSKASDVTAEKPAEKTDPKTKTSSKKDAEPQKLDTKTPTAAGSNSESVKIEIKDTSKKVTGLDDKEPFNFGKKDVKKDEKIKDSKADSNLPTGDSEKNKSDTKKEDIKFTDEKGQPIYITLYVENAKKDSEKKEVSKNPSLEKYVHGADPKIVLDPAENKYTLPLAWLGNLSVVTETFKMNENSKEIPLKDPFNPVLAMRLCKLLVKLEGKQVPEVEKPVRSSKFKESIMTSGMEWVADWLEENFEKIDETREPFYQFILCVNWIGYPALLNLVCAKMGSMIRQKEKT